MNNIHRQEAREALLTNVFQEACNSWGDLGTFHHPFNEYLVRIFANNDDPKGSMLHLNSLAIDARFLSLPYPNQYLNFTADVYNEHKDSIIEFASNPPSNELGFHLRDRLQYLREEGESREAVAFLVWWAFRAYTDEVKERFCNVFDEVLLTQVARQSDPKDMILYAESLGYPAYEELLKPLINREFEEKIKDIENMAYDWKLNDFNFLLDGDWLYDHNKETLEEIRYYSVNKEVFLPLAKDLFPKGVPGFVYEFNEILTTNLIRHVEARGNLESFLGEVAPHNDELPEIIYGRRADWIYSMFGEELEKFLYQQPEYEEHTFGSSFEVVQEGIQFLSLRYLHQVCLSQDQTLSAPTPHPKEPSIVAEAKAKLGEAWSQPKGKREEEGERKNKSLRM